MATNGYIYTTTTSSEPVETSYTATEYTTSSSSSNLGNVVVVVGGSNASSSTVQNIFQDGGVSTSGNVTIISAAPVVEPQVVTIAAPVVEQVVTVTAAPVTEDFVVIKSLSTENASKSGLVTVSTTAAPVVEPQVVTIAAPVIAAPVVEQLVTVAPVSGASINSALESTVFSVVEQAILRANNPVEINENDLITVSGETGVWANKAEVLSWKGVIPIGEYTINHDEQPEIIVKRTDQVVTYEQEIAVRYIRPPTPPPPGEIVIKVEKNILTPPAPPLVLRQQPPRPETPPPLVIREAPPKQPAAIGQKIITISGKNLPPPTRKVVIERLPAFPSKPEAIIIERWLPYHSQKRKVILQRSTDADPVIPKPKNVIVQWEAPQVEIKKQFRDLGIIRANPIEYVQTYGSSLKTHVELPQFVREIRPPNGVVLAAESTVSSILDLEGDIHALNLINLEGEGLGEYRTFLSRSGNGGGSSASGSGSNTTVVIDGGVSAGSGTVVIGSGSASGSNLTGGTTMYVIDGGATSNTTTYTVTTSTTSTNAVSVTDLFNVLDRDASGYISRVEVEKFLAKLNSRLGRSYGENQLNSFFKEADFNADGKISFDEFKRIIIKLFY